MLALGVAPADKVLARLEFPGARAKAEQGHQSLASEDVVTHLAARHRGVAKVVVTRDVLVPQARWRSAADRAHDLRHSYASFLVNAGRSLYEAQKLLGHYDPRVTMRYAHLSPGALIEAANVVADLVGKGTPLNLPPKSVPHR